MVEYSDPQGADDIRKQFKLNLKEQRMLLLRGSTHSASASVQVAEKNKVDREFAEVTRSRNKERLVDGASHNISVKTD